MGKKYFYSILATLVLVVLVVWSVGSNKTTNTKVAASLYNFKPDDFPIDFFRDPQYKKIISQAMNENEQKKYLFRYFVLSSEIQVSGNYWQGKEKEGDFIYGSGCMPHECGNRNGFFFLDVRSDAFYVFIYDRDFKEKLKVFTSASKNKPVLTLSSTRDVVVNVNHPVALDEWLKNR